MPSVNNRMKKIKILNAAMEVVEQGFPALGAALEAVNGRAYAWTISRLSVGAPPPTTTLLSLPVAIRQEMQRSLDRALALALEILAHHRSLLESLASNLESRGFLVEVDLVEALAPVIRKQSGDSLGLDHKRVGNLSGSGAKPYGETQGLGDLAANRPDVGRHHSGPDARAPFLAA